MRLLMITRKVDKTDPTYSFIYGWVNAFAKTVDELHVICLEQGDITGLPENTKIYSLGKEEGISRIWKICRFQALAWKLVPQVDGIFSHQNPEYGLLAVPYAKLFRKKLIGWYVHGGVNWRIRLLDALSYKMVSVNKESYRFPSKKVVFLHHGIDTDKFYFKPKEWSGGQVKLLSVSRISPSKNIGLMIEAVKKLNESEPGKYTLDIYGEAITGEQKRYLESLESLVKNENLSDYVFFRGGVPNDRLPEVYQAADLFLNFSDTGSVDKAVLEAMSCGTLVLTSNVAFNEMFLGMRNVKYCGKNDILYYLKNLTVIKGGAENSKEPSHFIKKNHSLKILTKNIVKLTA